MFKRTWQRYITQPYIKDDTHNKWLISCVLTLPEDTKSRVRSSMTPLFSGSSACLGPDSEWSRLKNGEHCNAGGEACCWLYDVSLSADFSTRHVTLPRPCLSDLHRLWSFCIKESARFKRLKKTFELKHICISFDNCVEVGDIWRKPRFIYISCFIQKSNTMCFITTGQLF